MPSYRPIGAKLLLVVADPAVRSPTLVRSRLRGFRRLGHLDQPAGLHVVDIAVDRHASGDERVSADASDVGSDALGARGRVTPSLRQR